MSARAPAPAESPRELADQHDQRLHRAKQLAEPVAPAELTILEQPQ